ncbi:MAG: sulfatase, partial [Longimicrobiales bacterium]
VAIVTLLGPVAARRVDTRGLERNPVFSLLRTAVPRVHAQPAHADWRASPFPQVPPTRPTHPLHQLRGRAAGHNILLVVLESTAARYLRPYGATQDPMPNLSELAQRSIVFENAYAVFPESVKGLVALLASRYPGFDVPAERHADLMAPSLASVLSAGGYRTALFHSGRFFYLGMAELLARSGFHDLEDAGDMGGNHKSSFGIDEDAAVRRILGWVDGLPAERRFFAVYLPIAGHHPYATTRPGPFEEHEEADRYRNALHEGDRALGALLAGLRTRGLDRNTLIVVVGDHGEAFGQHAGNYGHNLALYDENVRVPLILSLPKGKARAERVPTTASVLDLAPTMLDLLGVTPPVPFQGESLLDGRERMALFFTDYSLGLLGVRDGCLKLIHELESNRTRAFDLCRDAEEQRDIAETMVARIPTYRESLRRWSAAQLAAIPR